MRLVAERDLTRTIRSLYGRGRARQIQRSLNPECLSGIGKDSRYRIRRAEVILPVDAGEFTFYDCAYEELLQALGAINDDRSVPWTMFNDDVQMGFFDVYDQYLLNILYDPRIHAGHDQEDVEADCCPRSWRPREHGSTSPNVRCTRRGMADLPRIECPAATAASARPMKTSRPRQTSGTWRRASAPTTMSTR